MATGEEEIVVDSSLCPSTNKDYMKQIRADFTVCSLPSDSLTGSCISGAENEPDNCGYQSNFQAFCRYCAKGSANSTDSCCSDANAPSRCEHVPVPTSTPTLPPLVPSSSSTPTLNNGSNHHHKGGLSGGRIAGAVVGSVVGFALLVALAVFLLLCLRRRRRSEPDTLLNQPNPQRRGLAPMNYAPNSQGYEILPPGSRVARMSALREVPSHSPSHSMPAAIYGDSPESDRRGASPGAFSRGIPPITGRRHGSLSSNSALAAFDSSDHTSPQSGGAAQYSSPEEVTSSLSEQLAAFRDYYSQDDIHPGDKVSVLWAYQARAGDEFELDRGEMLKVIGIWDDGWATGVRLAERAEDFDANHRQQRDSGVSSGSRRPASTSPVGEIKAFPLVCVCLPQHWSKIAEGESDGQLDDGSQ